MNLFAVVMLGVLVGYLVLFGAETNTTSTSSNSPPVKKNVATLPKTAATRGEIVATTFPSLATVAPAPLLSSVDELAPARQVEQVLIGRNVDARRSLLAIWLSYPPDPKDVRLAALMAKVYANESRLAAIGVHRAMIADGATLQEVPAYVFSEAANIRLDPWLPLAGKTFVIVSDRR